VVATRWHGDGLIGRIEKAMADDPLFPQFKSVKYPAWTDGYGWLFDERFPPSFYKSTRVALGKYAWAALYMCNPTPREGGLLKVDSIDVRDSMPDGLKWMRFWDPASGKKERAKNDPDWSVGTKLAVTKDVADERILHLWVADVVSVQAEAPERDRLIIQTAARDGRAVAVGIEKQGAYKDLYTWMRKLLKGKATVRGINAAKDLVARGEALEPIFEAGHVHVLRAEWNDAWASQLRSFPNAAHDDKVASLIGGFEMAARDRRIIFGPSDVVLDKAAARALDHPPEGPVREAPRYTDVDTAGGVDLPDEDGGDSRQRMLDDDSAWT